MKAETAQFRRPRAFANNLTSSFVTPTSAKGLLTPSSLNAKYPGLCVLRSEAFAPLTIAFAFNFFAMSNNAFARDFLQ